MCFAPLAGHPVKQADTVMLGYPLGLPMSPEIRRNDLEAYEPVTDPHGPAMTWVGHGLLYARHKCYVVITPLFPLLGYVCNRLAGARGG